MSICTIGRGNNIDQDISQIHLSAMRSIFFSLACIVLARLIVASEKLASFSKPYSLCCWTCTEFLLIIIHSVNTLNEQMEQNRKSVLVEYAVVHQDFRNISDFLQSCIGTSIVDGLGGSRTYNSSKMRKRKELLLNFFYNP